jgi:hypothetical protein
MEHRRGLELAAIFALSLLASVTALELDYEVFSAVSVRPSNGSGNSPKEGRLRSSSCVMRFPFVRP